MLGLLLYAFCYANQQKSCDIACILTTDDECEVDVFGLVTSLRSEIRMTPEK